jgi:hypothetical protein
MTHNGLSGNTSEILSTNPCEVKVESKSYGYNMKKNYGIMIYLRC